MVANTKVDKTSWVLNEIAKRIFTYKKQNTGK